MNELAVSQKHGLKHFAGSPILSELEKNVDGLDFIEELTFENGAVYRGYLRDGIRHGPGS